MTCGKCNKKHDDEAIGTGAEEAAEFMIVAVAADAAAAPAEYVDVQPHWDPGFRFVSARNGAKLILAGGVCGVGYTSAAQLYAINGSLWVLCRPLGAAGVGGRSPFIPKMYKKVAGGVHRSWTPATSTEDLAVPVYFVGGHRARVKVGNVTQIRRVLAVANGGPTGLLVRLGREVQPFGSGGCLDKRIQQLAGTGAPPPPAPPVVAAPIVTKGQGGRGEHIELQSWQAASGTNKLNNNASQTDLALAASTVGPSRSRHLQRRRR